MKAIVSGLLLLLSIHLTGATQAEIIGILQPRIMRMDDKHLYVADRDKVWLYSRFDWTFIKHFAPRGQGPGEFLSRPDFVVYRGNILFRDQNKYMVYSDRGNLLKEERIPNGFSDIYPISGKFLAKKQVIKEGNGEIIHYIGIFDQQFQPLVTLAKHRDDAFRPQAGARPRVNIVSHCFKARVYRDRIYLADTHKGLYVEVFDLNGRKLFAVNHAFTPEPAGAGYLESFIEYRKKNHSWEKIRNTFDFVTSSYLPAFKDFRIVDDRIYLISHPGEYKGTRHRITLLNLNGDRIKEKDIRLTDPWCIKDGKVFSLEENRDEDTVLEVQPL